MEMHSAGKTLRNTAIYIAATIAQKAISFIYFLILSTNVSPAILGAYVGMLSIASLAAIGTDLGLTPLLTRESVIHKNEAARLLRVAYAIKIPLVLATLLFLWIIAPLLIDLSLREKMLLLGGSLIITFDAFTSGAFAILRGRQNVFVESRAILLFQTTVFVLGSSALFFTGNILVIMASLVFGSFVNFFYVLSSLRKYLGESIWPVFDKALARHLLKMLPAFTSSGIFTKIYQQADVVLLRALTEAGTVGLYSIPAKITTALQTLVPGAFSAAIYPTMANYARADRERLSLLWSYTVGVLLLISLPLGLFLAVLTPELLRLLWPAYSGVAPAMRVMLAALPFLFLPYASGPMLNALGREHRNSWNRGIMTAVFVLMNLLLIPFFGVLGAAWSFFLANALLVLLDFFSLRKEFSVFGDDLKRMIRGAVVSSTFSAILLWVATNTVSAPRGRWALFFYIIMSSVIAGGTYLVMAFFSNALRMKDVQTARDMLFARDATSSSV